MTAATEQLSAANRKREDTDMTTQPILTSQQAAAWHAMQAIDTAAAHAATLPMTRNEANRFLDALITAKACIRPHATITAPNAH